MCPCVSDSPPTVAGEIALDRSGAFGGDGLPTIAGAAVALTRGEEDRAAQLFGGFVGCFAVSPAVTASPTRSAQG